MGVNFINFTPLIDAKTGIFCHLLEVGKIKIIVDCGIGKNFDYSIYNEVKNIIEKADCILLTSFDISHMGAIGLFKNVNVYCSIPTAVMGRVILNEQKYRLGDRILSDFSPKQLKYSQPFKINDIEISAHNTGYIIGNSSYKIISNQQSIGISYNLNHKKENFLEGFDFGAFENLDVFITNSAYVKAPKITTKVRDDNINNIICSKLEQNPDAKIVISVPYTRLFEILNIIKIQPILILSSYMNNFIERSKSMIEWANSKIDLLSDFSNVFFGTVSDINNYKIIIVDDDYEFGYLGSVLNIINDKNTTLLLFDNENECFYPEKLNVYDYTYKKVQVASPSEQVKNDESESSDKTELDHWSCTTNTIFVDSDSDNIPTFSYVRRKKQTDPYGETLKFNFENKIQEYNLENVSTNDFVIHEDRNFVNCGIECNFNILYLSLFGISDVVSCKTIIESLLPNKIVIVNDFKDCADYLSTSFSIGKNKIETYVGNQKINLRSYSIVATSTISENIMKLNYKKLVKYKIAKFKALRNNEIVEMIGDYEKITIGCIDIISIKKSLLEAGFHVETKNNELFVNDIIRISVEGTILNFSSANIELSSGVRDVLYNFLAII